MKLTDYDPSKIPGTYLFTGESGSGKSVASATMGGRDATHYIFDFDYRIDGVAAAKHLVNLEKIEFDQYPATTQGIAKYNDKVDSILNTFRAGGKGPDVLEMASAGAFTQAVLACSRETIKGGEKVNIGGREFTFNGPKDYGFETTTMQNFVNTIRRLPCIVVVHCHVVEKWGKPDGEKFAQNVVVGEKLNLRDNIAASFVGQFTNVFRFDRELRKQGLKESLIYSVRFADADTAKNGHGIPPGKHNITDVSFWDYYQQLLKGDVKRGTEEVRKELGL